MSYKCYIGIDISKVKLDLAYLTEEGEITNYLCQNNQRSIEKQFSILFKEKKIKKEETLIIAENTGHYCNPLVWAMIKKGYHFWLECPSKIHNSQGIKRGKNDKIDSERIAIYGKRFKDEVKLIQPSNLCLEELEYLKSERELHIKNRSKYKSQLTDHEGYINPIIMNKRKRRYKNIIDKLDLIVANIEKEMDELIKSDDGLKKQITLLQSIVGIGKQIALNVLISTKGFTKFTDPRKYACHAGVAPFRYTSGSSIRSANKVSKRANLKLKSVIHMGALSAIGVEGEFKDYFDRKVKEGKNKMSVLNAVRNKLIQRMFAVIKYNRPYERNFVSDWNNV